MTYSIGDKILYGAVGIMEVVDIRDENIADEPKSYYVLKEVNTASDSKTFVPTDNERLVSLMHPLLSKSEIVKILEKGKSIPQIEWESNNRIRSERYRALMESGDRLGIISMIKSIEEMGKERATQGKKNYIADDTAMRRAIKLLNLEISIVMNISVDEAQLFVDSKIR